MERESKVTIHYAEPESSPPYSQECNGEDTAGRICLQIESRVGDKDFPDPQVRVLPSCLGMMPRQVINQSMTVNELLSRDGCVIISKDYSLHENALSMAERVMKMHDAAWVHAKDELAKSHGGHITHHIITNSDNFKSHIERISGIDVHEFLEAKRFLRSFRGLVAHPTAASAPIPRKLTDGEERDLREAIGALHPLGPKSVSKFLEMYMREFSEVDFAKASKKYKGGS